MEKIFIFIGIETILNRYYEGKLIFNFNENIYYT